MPPEALRADDPRKALPPLYGALLKNEQDVHLFEQVMFCSGASSAAEADARFRFTLRDAGIPVTVTEYLALLAALDARVAVEDVDGFYYLARRW